MGLRSMSLILMRDEGRTFKVRLAPQSLLIFVVCLLLIPICLVLSIWLNVLLYNEREFFVQKQHDLQEKVHGNAQKIARLTSLEQFLEARSPNLLHTLIPRSDISADELETVGMAEEKITQELEEIRSQLVAHAHTSQKKPHDFSGEVETKNDPTVSENVAEMLQNTQSSDIDTTKTNHVLNESGADNNNAEDNSENGHDTLSSSSVASNSLGDEEAKKAQEENIQTFTAFKDIEEIDLQYVEVEDVQIKQSSGRLKINYILRNAGKKSPVTGQQLYYIVSITDGNLTKTPLTNVTDNSFRIKYMKEVESDAKLGSVEIKNTDALLLEVYEHNELVYSKIYAID